ncbi:hypothetical protein BHMPCIPO_01206 [Ensifer sesbaniae]|nr:hypothetical protein [Ensifer sesbaniae]
MQEFKVLRRFLCVERACVAGENGKVTETVPYDQSSRSDLRPRWRFSADAGASVHPMLVSVECQKAVELG